MSDPLDSVLAEVAKAETISNKAFVQSEALLRSATVFQETIEMPRYLKLVRRRNLVQADGLSEVDDIARSLQHLMQVRCGHRSGKLGQYRDIASVLCGHSNYKAVLKLYRGSVNTADLISTLLLQDPLVVIDSLEGTLARLDDTEAEAIYFYQDKLYVLTDVTAKNGWTLDLTSFDALDVTLHHITSGHADAQYYVGRLMRLGASLGQAVAEGSEKEICTFGGDVYITDGRSLTQSQHEIDINYTLKHSLFSVINGSTGQHYHILHSGSGAPPVDTLYFTDDDHQLRVMPRSNLIRLLEHASTLYTGRGELGNHYGYVFNEDSETMRVNDFKSVIVLLENLVDDHHLVIYNAIDEDPMTVNYMMISAHEFAHIFEHSGNYLRFDGTPKT